MRFLGLYFEWHLALPGSNVGGDVVGLHHRSPREAIFILSGIWLLPGVTPVEMSYVSTGIAPWRSQIPAFTFCVMC